jgi:hypothetical protein
MAPAPGAAERICDQVIQNLPRNLLLLDKEELRSARRHRDERMSLLFRSWPSLSKIELRELRKLSDERQRLARHVGNLRSLHALRATSSLNTNT